MQKFKIRDLFKIRIFTRDGEWGYEFLETFGGIAYIFRDRDSMLDDLIHRLKEESDPIQGQSHTIK